MSVESEAKGTTRHDVTWRDLTLTVETDPSKWSIDALEAMQDGREVVALRELLGPKQWADVKTKAKTGADLTELGQVIESAGGFREGE